MSQPQNFLGGAVVGAVAKVALPIVLEQVFSRVEKRGGGVKELREEIVKDPRVANELNAEKPYQSRVAVGSTASAVGVLVPAGVQVLNALGFDIAADQTEYAIQVISAAITLWGAGYALYGRFKSGLKPLFSRD
jgi:hypothetical protein